MKKFFALILAVIMVLTLAACTSQDQDNNDTSDNNTEDQQESQEPDEGQQESQDDQDNQDESDSPEGENDQEPVIDGDVPPQDDTGSSNTPITPDSGSSSNSGSNSGSSSSGSGSGSNSNSNSGSDSQGDSSGSTGGSNTEEPSEPADSGESSGTTDLSSTMASILNGVADLPAVWDIPLDSENFEFYAFIPYVDGYRGLASDAMIGSIAHSCVLVEVPDGTDVQSVADSIEANANPAKWICVTAEKTTVSVNGNLILLVMTSAAAADAIVANFQAL